MANLVFLVAEIVILLLCILLVVAVGVGRMESSVGRSEDGHSPGSSAPRWKLRDTKGHWRQTPSKHRPQLLLFADRCLKAYPSLVRCLNEIDEDANSDGQPSPSPLRNVEILLLTLAGRLDEGMAHELGLTLPIVAVDWSLYSRYRIQRIPFAFLVSPSGVVIARSLVGSDAALMEILHRRGPLMPSGQVDRQPTHVGGSVP